jgi:hypothetical protein
MSFTNRILLDTFKYVCIMDFIGGHFTVEQGDVEQNGQLHKKMAMRVTVQYDLPDNDSTYVQIFKGYNRLDKAADWLFQMTEGAFTTVAKDHLAELIAIDAIIDKSKS